MRLLADTGTYPCSRVLSGPRDAGDEAGAHKKCDVRGKRETLSPAHVATLRRAVVSIAGKPQAEVTREKQGNGEPCAVDSE
jgi:hypothetical protein